MIEGVNSEINGIKAQIDDIDHELANLKNGWLNSILNSSEITDLENKRSQLRKKEDELTAKYNELK